jgi:hypothetical protein
LSDVHDVLNVSQLKKYLRVPEEQLPMEDLDAKDDLSYQEHPIKILEMPEALRGTRRSICARCNGVIIPRKKPHGKEKKS